MDLQGSVWRGWVQMVAWHCWERQVVATAVARAGHYLVCRSIHALIAFAKWRVLKRIVKERSSSRRATALRQAAFLQWCSMVSRRRQARRAFQTGQGTRFRQLAERGVRAWSAAAAWRRRKRVAVDGRMVMLARRVAAAWHTCTRRLTWARLAVEAGHARRLRSRLAAAFQAWLAFGGLVQRSRRLARAAESFQTAARRRRSLRHWCGAAATRRQARRGAEDLLQRRLLANVGIVLLCWQGTVRARRERRVETRGVVLHWGHCFMGARRSAAVRTWRRSATQSRWNRLAKEEAVWRGRAASRASCLKHWAGWSHNRRRFNAFALQAAARVRDMCLAGAVELWASAARAEAALRRSAGALKVWSVGVRRGHALAAMASAVTQSRARQHRLHKAMQSDRNRVSNIALFSWVQYLARRRLKRLQEAWALGLRLRSLGRAVTLQWRCVAFRLHLLRKSASTAMRCCWSALQMHAEARAAWRQRIQSARWRLASQAGLRTWNSQWRGRVWRRSAMRDLGATKANRCVGATLRAWRTAHADELRLRDWLVMRAAMRQWQSYVAAVRTHILAMQDVMASAARHNRRRLCVGALHRWCWHVAWVLANVEASARLIRERREMRLRHENLRRRAVGPNDEEILLLSCIFSAWMAYHAACMKIFVRIFRERAAHNHALLLLSLDAWVDGALNAQRAENLRRRRHVRFASNSKAPALRRPASPRAAAQASNSPHKKAPTRSISAGNLGQWAQPECWETTSALTQVLDISRDYVDSSVTRGAWDP